jgi:hypothetical protein
MLGGIVFDEIVIHVVFRDEKLVATDFSFCAWEVQEGRGGGGFWFVGLRLRLFSSNHYLVVEWIYCHFKR